MEIFKIVALGITATILAVIVKQYKPEYGVHISIAAGVVIFLLMISKLASILEVIHELTNKLDIEVIYLKSIFKIIGIAYITEFGAQVCRDTGESSIASKIEFAGKIIIMTLALPILLSVLNLIIKLIH
ncbi:stage III sporulation protein AD [Paramaledivibacter caminithermalis]|jgi:stage III sporulation protein AD|uniref:Stage III sporulation protein AD n=1 Tax=Paramaledivibacter caminithermalis (strain DSM 15212 / CIP 107654 / DViRD3) TaxID=1121301 RepID=A0A1M6JR37_PARC5|nr:stage III sporulation protein AD [Paramaledivibacter caminithermalis]SHJ49147.1 stage III sporulation protein AD [Paramaledivibacter caminithermalis DSM 15212]